MKKSYSTPVLWAGSAQAFEIYCQAELAPQGVPTPLAGGTVVERHNNDSDSTPSPSRLLQVQEGIGVISINGVLTNSDHWTNEYCGMISYNEIRTALYLAVADPAVKEILMDVGSPGGAVSGLMDAVDAVDQAGKVKRLTAYSASSAHSAAMWLTAPAKQRFGSPVSSWGSIGVVMRHAEHTKMAEMEGIKETIIRSGAFKQLGNDAEVLSQKAEAVFQEQVDHLNQVFEDSVAGYLGVTSAIVSGKMGQGREFIGSQAVAAGLIDATKSFDDVYSTIRNRVAKAGATTPQGGIDMVKKYAMSAATALAAAAAGINPGEEVVETPVEASTEGAPDPGEVGVTTEAPAAETTTVATDAESAVVTMLKSQLAEKDDSLFSLKTELASLQAATVGVDKLKEIVAQTIDTMSVSMAGAATPGLAAFPTATLLDQFEATSTKFNTWWSKVTPGGTAATSAADTEVKREAPKLSRMEASRLAASQITPTK